MPTVTGRGGRLNSFDDFRKNYTFFLHVQFNFIFFLLEFNQSEPNEEFKVSGD